MNYLDWIARLQAGETISRTVHGRSMEPRLRNGATVTITPVTDLSNVGEDDIVFCKVRGNFYVHKVVSVKQHEGRRQFQIGNNHGRINGWTFTVYGKVIAVV